LSQHLSTAEVARILGMQESQIREILRSGVLRAARRGRRYAFSFQDLVVLRAARELLERHVPAARVRRALAALVRELPEGRPLSGLRIAADGRQVAVFDGAAAWQPESGQTLFQFELDPLVRQVEELRGVDRPRPEALDRREQAERAFEQALDLEDLDPKAAAEAYGRALELDPERVDAYVNLGRIAHESGDARLALRLYEEARLRSPDDPVIHFNLALAVEDTHGPEAALQHYQRALALDPAFADAHYNLAGLCEQLGHARDAIRHYRTYQRLTRS
jgi:excisionase family DNA binding protein